MMMMMMLVYVQGIVNGADFFSLPSRVGHAESQSEVLFHLSLGKYLCFSVFPAPSAVRRGATYIPALAGTMALPSNTWPCVTL